MKISSQHLTPELDVSDLTYSNTWGVFNSAGEAVFDIDSTIDLNYDNQSKVSNFPTEKGAFVSYNKVANPYRARVRLAVGGSSARIDAFIVKLDEVQADLNLYNVVTPERTYIDMNLEKVSYSRAKDHGSNMIVADLDFIQIRQVKPQYANVKRKGSAKKVDTGQAQPQKPPPDLANVDAKTAFLQGLRREVGGK